MNKFNFIFLLILFFTGCSSEDNFYTKYQVDDLWRIPLVKPYELKNVAGASPDEFYNDNWHLMFKKLKFEKFERGVNVTKVNIDKDIIYGYGTANPCQHFIINGDTGEEHIYENKNEWIHTLDSLGLSVKDLKDVFEVFNNYKNSSKLPWKINKEK